jgi:hypothetical protein
MWPDQLLANAVNAWYGEEQYYNYNNPGFNSLTGHFTQVVWKDTSLLGCAYKDCGNIIIVSCKYWPPGNVLGYFQTNVKVP